MKRFWAKTVSLICVAVLFVVQFSFLSHAATYPQTGITNSSTKIYTLPGTTGHEANAADKGKSKLITTLSKGTTVQIMGIGIDGDGDEWYQIKYGTGYKNDGYAFNTRVDITVPDYVHDEEFEKWLNEQAFPESYKVKLRSLHMLYPNWVFYADHVTDSWSTVLSKMSGLGTKLVHGTSNNAWKSMEKGAYNWAENEWVTGWDTGYWVAADSRVVAYYLDPRNFLDEEYIFMFYNQGLSDRDNMDTLKRFLKGTFMSGTLEDNSGKTYADVLWAAGTAAKVSPYTLAAVIRQEQGSNGAGASISGTVAGYQGLYNYYNICAYADKGLTAVEHGLWWAKGASNSATTYSRPWNTREKAIMGGAYYYGEDYVSAGQNTLYYKNFNVYKNSKHALYTHLYATNIEDTKGKTAGLRSAYVEMFDEALEFHIPVYKNMPDTTSLPKAGTSNDRFLKSIKVGSAELADFDRYKYSYDYIVDKSVSSVTLTATASDSTSTVTGDGQKTLQYGDNKFTITVKSTSGLTTDYIVNIFREGDGAAEVVEPTITTDYKIETYITAVQPETSISAFKDKFSVKNGSFKIFEASGKEKTDGYISTGDIIRIINSSGNVYDQKNIVIYGDANGDGKINSTDRLRIRKHILKESILNNANFEAADTNKDGKVNSTDRLRIRKHILKEAKIQQ